MGDKLDKFYSELLDFLKARGVLAAICTISYFDEAQQEKASFLSFDTKDAVNPSLSEGEAVYHLVKSLETLLRNSQAPEESKEKIKQHIAKRISEIF